MPTAQHIARQKPSSMPAGYPTDTVSSTRAAGSPATGIIKCAIITVLSLAVIIGLIILIIWLVIRPAPIDYSVEKAAIHNYNLSSSNALNAAFDLSLQTNNHNKRVSIYYDYVEVSVWYMDQMVAFTNYSPFHQPKHNVTVIHVTPSAMSVPLMGSTVKKLKRERTKGVANLEVRVKARIRFKFGRLKSKHYTMKVKCYPVLVHYYSNKFKRVDCDVDI